MHLENIVLDAVDPARVGRFWEAVLGGERLSDGPEGFETRPAIPGGPVLDLCVQPVPDPPTEPLRLHLDLLGGDRQRELVDRFLVLGARHLDIGQGKVPWVDQGRRRRTMLSPAPLPARAAARAVPGARPQGERQEQVPSRRAPRAR